MLAPVLRVLLQELMRLVGEEEKEGVVAVMGEGEGQEQKKGIAHAQYHRYSASSSSSAACAAGTGRAPASLHISNTRCWIDFAPVLCCESPSSSLPPGDGANPLVDQPRPAQATASACPPSLSPRSLFCAVAPC